MSTIKKLIQKMESQPNGIKFQELEKVLNYINFFETRQKGSHKRFKNEKTQESITIPVQNPMKAIYIKKILEIIEEEQI